MSVGKTRDKLVMDKMHGTPTTRVPNTYKIDIDARSSWAQMTTGGAVEGYTDTGRTKGAGQQLGDIPNTHPWVKDEVPTSTHTPSPCLLVHDFVFV